MLVFLWIASRGYRFRPGNRLIFAGELKPIQAYRPSPSLPVRFSLPVGGASLALAIPALGQPYEPDNALRRHTQWPKSGFL